MYITAGTLVKEYTEGWVVTLAHDEVVIMLLLQAKVATEAARVVNLYHVVSTICGPFGECLVLLSFA